jgi:hypothetical protein
VIKTSNKKKAIYELKKTNERKEKRKRLEEWQVR